MARVAAWLRAWLLHPKVIETPLNLRIRAYLAATEGNGEAPWLLHGGKVKVLTRYYLGLLASGVPPVDGADLDLVRSIVAEWERKQSK